MKHPDSDEILEYFWEELSEERTHEIQEHLKMCEECRDEFHRLQAVGDRLAEWQDEPVAEESIENVRSRLQLLRATAIEQTGVNGRARRSYGIWFRRVTGVAAVVALMLLFQTFIWNPIKSSVDLLAVFNLSTTAFAMPADQALPDTVLVITVHSDETFSTSLLSGRYKLSELTEELGALIPQGEFRHILLMGEEKADPVSLALEDLDSLKEELGIREVHVGEGVIGVASVLFENWMNLKDPRWLLSPSSEYLFFNKDEGWTAGEGWTIRAFPGQEAFIAWSRDSLFTNPLRSANLHNFWIRSALTLDPDDVLLKALTEPSSVTATVDENGDYILSRAVVSVEEVEASLRKILDLDPELGLTILVKDEDDPGDAALRLESVARRLGFERITFKEVKKL